MARRVGSGFCIAITARTIDPIKQRRSCSLIARIMARERIIPAIWDCLAMVWSAAACCGDTVDVGVGGVAGATVSRTSGAGSSRPITSSTTPLRAPLLKNTALAVACVVYPMLDGKIASQTAGKTELFGKGYCILFRLLKQLTKKLVRLRDQWLFHCSPSFSARPAAMLSMGERSARFPALTAAGAFRAREFTAAMPGRV